MITSAEKVQPIKHIGDFARLGVPACVLAGGQKATVQALYPNLDLKTLDDTSPSKYHDLINHVRNGTCKGAISTDVHMRYTIVEQGECDVDLTGSLLNGGYYGIAFKRDHRQEKP